MGEASHDRIPPCCLQLRGAPTPQVRSSRIALVLSTLGVDEAAGRGCRSTFSQSKGRVWASTFSSFAQAPALRPFCESDHPVIQTPSGGVSRPPGQPAVSCATKLYKTPSAVSRSCGNPFNYEEA